jgi:hypothetical protein
MRKALLALVLLAGLPGTAAGATVSAERGDDSYDGNVTIADLRGQPNHLTVTTAIDGVVTVVEREHAYLTARGGCRQRAAKRVTCNLGDRYPAMLDADLGGGGDALSVDDQAQTLPDVVVHGGAGDDRLTFSGGLGAVAYGGPGRDVLRGTDARDWLQGGAGRDRLLGRGGDDSLSGDPGRLASPANDVLDGGDGRDTASWAGRLDSVRVDLAAGRGGEPGEQDTLRSIENAVGGEGRDRLLGTSGPNTLLGSYGGDVLDGRGGSDLLDAGSTTDQTQREGDRGDDSLRCGPGRDTVRDPDRDVVPPDCELLSSVTRIPLDGRSVHAQPRQRAGGVEVETICPGDVSECTRGVTLRSGGRVLGRSEAQPVRPHERAWIFAPLGDPLPRDRPIRIDVTGTDDEGDADGPYPYAYGWSVRR